MVRFLAVGVLLSPLGAAASDPLEKELKACEAYCAARGEAALGIRSAPFGAGMGRACVCEKSKPVGKPRPAAPRRESAPKSEPSMMGATPFIEDLEAPGEGQFAAGTIDCDSPAVQACLKRPPRYHLPLTGLPTDLPAGGEFDVTIVETSDYECPYCRRVQETMESVRGDRRLRIRYVFMHHPLNFHARAMPAALAAAAAQRQGKFWTMHRRIFTSNETMSDAHLEALAQASGLDLARYRRDLNDPNLRKEVERQKALGTRLGVRGTPAFFINGRLVSGAMPKQRFLEEIRFAQSEAKRLRMQGLRDSDAIYQRLISKGLHKATPLR